MTVHEAYPKTRLFVEQPLQPGGVVALVEKQAHYLRHVLRLNEGEAITLFNRTDGEWRAIIERIGKKDGQARLVVQTRPRGALPDGWLVFSPLKAQAMEWLAEKATELGIARLQPVITEYSVVRQVNTERLERRCIEAAEQCERVELPEVMEAKPLEKILGDWPPDRVLLVADESGAGEPAGTVLRDLPPSPWAILTGPEGGFSKRDREAIARVPSVKTVGLGPRILRAETAALTLLAVTQSYMGDWHEPPQFRSHLA